MRISPEQFREMAARLERNAGRLAVLGDAVERESDLADDLESLCRSKGWLYIRARTDKRSTIAVGWPDFSIFMERRKECFMELKRKGGKATKEQNETIAHLKHLGYVAGIVESMTGAHELIEEAKKQV